MTETDDKDYTFVYETPENANRIPIVQQNHRSQRERNIPKRFEDYVLLIEDSPLTYEKCI